MITKLSVHASTDCREWHVLCNTCMRWMQKNSVCQCCISGISQFIDVGWGNIWTCCLIFSALDAFLKSDPLHEWQTWHWTLNCITRNNLDGLCFACCVQTLTFPPLCFSFFSPELSPLSSYTWPWTCFTPNAALLFACLHVETSFTVVSAVQLWL